MRAPGETAAWPFEPDIKNRTEALLLQVPQLCFLGLFCLFEFIPVSSGF